MIILQANRGAGQTHHLLITTTCLSVDAAQYKPGSDAAPVRREIPDRNDILKRRLDGPRQRLSNLAALAGPHDVESFHAERTTCYTSGDHAGTSSCDSYGMSAHAADRALMLVCRPGGQKSMSSTVTVVMSPASRASAVRTARLMGST